MKLLLFSLLAAVVCLSGGCRRDLYKPVPVHGKVTSCDGKPAAGGTIVFTPIDEPATTGRAGGNPGREARGEVGADGTFTLTTIGITPQPGAVTGPHRVTFEMPTGKRPVLLPGEKAGMSPDEIKKVEADFASRPVYPPLPCSDQIEPGQVTVKDGDNEFEFKLPAK